MDATVGVFQILCIFAIIALSKGFLSEDGMTSCNRVPLGTTAAALEPDNRFVLEIVDLDLATQEYIPNRQYPIRLGSVDNKTTFIAFTIWTQEDVNENEKNPRRPHHLSPGKLQAGSENSMVLPKCANTIVQTDVMPKTSVEVLWTAPDKNNKCVTIQAYIAIKPDVWYTSTGPLAKQVCEDRRKNEDMKPMENDNCNVCEEARYELKFEGSWSYNTHKKLYPEPPLGNSLEHKEGIVAAFSDIVGASHNKNYYVYKDSTYASEGLKMLAEQGNTTKLEMEILEHLGINVRTVIKATAPAKTNMSTVASFRANKEKHLISLVTSLLPSPDWFLGVYNLELCDSKNNSWAEHIVLNLYPLDAGTDSGKNFDSPNEASSPAQPIVPAVINREVTKEDTKPFAKLRVNLIRTYYNPNCPTESSSPEPTEEPVEQTYERETRPPPPPPPIRTTSSPPVYRPPPPTEETTEGKFCSGYWEELPCEGPCVEGRREGFRSKVFHFVRRDGGRGRRKDEDDTKPPEGCKPVESPLELCDEECEDEEGAEEETTEEAVVEETAERRVWRDPLKPGQSWNGRK